MPHPEWETTAVRRALEDAVMDDRAFRRERLLASGLLREPQPAELAVVARALHLRAALRPMRDGGEAACSSGVMPVHLAHRAGSDQPRG